MRVTSCPGTWCGWTPSRSATPRRRTRTDAAARHRRAGARHLARGTALARDQGIDDDRRAAADVPGRRGRAAHVDAVAALRALRRGVPRAVDDGGEAASPRPARRARGLPRA